MVGRDEALEALHREVAGHAFEYATGLDVTDGGPAGFLVRVRAGQRLRPATLVVAADEQSLALDHSVDEPLPVDDVEMWAFGVRIWLAEQLDTGVLRWGRRVTLPDGTTAIDPSIRPGPASPWWVSSVPLLRPTPPGQRQLRRAARSRRGGLVTLGGSIEFQPDPAPGGHLHHAGLDVGPGRAATSGGRLVAWLQLYLDHSGGSPPVGQLVVAWGEGSETVVQLEHLEYRPSAPRAAIEGLVLAGLHAAADAGARVIEHRLDDREPLQSRLPWQLQDGVMCLDTADVP
ncbi:MAG: hypothetical protein LC679_19050 [Intrasporangiaceae bacterium]|nr:hypothetical protein [Intrasporangiaceae bacterium]